MTVIITQANLTDDHTHAPKRQQEESTGEDANTTSVAGQASVESKGNHGSDNDVINAVVVNVVPGATPNPCTPSRESPKPIDYKHAFISVRRTASASAQPRKVSSCLRGLFTFHFRYLIIAYLFSFQTRTFGHFPMVTAETAFSIRTPRVMSRTSTGHSDAGSFQNLMMESRWTRKAGSLSRRKQLQTTLPSESSRKGHRRGLYHAHRARYSCNALVHTFVSHF